MAPPPKVARSDAPLLVSLDEPAGTDPLLVGRKAATLARLRRSGHPVPDGVVITTAATDPAAAAVTESCRAALPAALERLGGGPFAVRSSGIAEDGREESLAGRFETVLGAGGLDEVLGAVERVVASAHDEHAMAVLVQPLLAAASAGVAFSANPVTGERDEVIVHAVRGLGDRLVAGEATPQEWVVRRDEADLLASPEDAIDHDDARAVARLARRLEDELGEPQDIEWALASGELHLLQARPITALPVPPDLEIPPGTWVKDTAHYPTPITPLGESVYLPAIEDGTAAMCAAFGLLIDGVEQRSLGGEVYVRILAPGGKEGPPPPSWLLGILARLHPDLRRRCSVAHHAVRSGRLADLPRRWWEEWRHELADEVAVLRGVEVEALDDERLDAHLGDTIDLLRRGERIHFMLFLPYVVALHDLVRLCEEHLGWTTAETLTLVQGVSEASSEPSRALVEIASLMRANDHARAVVDRAGADVVERLRDVAPAIADQAERYLESYGQRTLGYDPGSPMLAERPELFARLLADAVERRGAGSSGDLEDRRRDAVAGARERLGPDERARFDAALAVAERTYGMREDNVILTDLVPNGLIRRAVLEIGRRLASRGRLESREDAVWLSVDELRRALAGRDGDDALTELVRRRRAERRWVAAHPGPAFHGAEPAPPPDVRRLPPAARRLNSALLWMAASEFDLSSEASHGELLRGRPGSPGRHTGTARIIRAEEDFVRLRPGDVLVAPVTTPSWSVLFAIAGAVVTDGGSILSHTAIVAREHGIPAVLGVGIATSALRDGENVTVDGSAGTVVIHETRREP